VAPYALPRAASPPATRDSSARQGVGKAPIFTTFSALAVAIGLFLLVAWLCRRKMPAASRALPPDVVELLGRTRLADRQYAHLMRVGNKLLLVAISSGGADTLTEITDPGEVDRLAGLCKQFHAGSTTTAFRQALQQFSREPPAAGFVDGGRDQSAISTPGRQPVREPSHA
jgi:flagellar biogenesis protein FliO